MSNSTEQNTNNNSELDKWLKFQLICKPEQSGKTFIMIKQIIEDFTDVISNKPIINWVFCDNNLLLTKQTSIRIEDDLKEYVYGEVSYIEFSSHSSAQARDHAGVFMAIVAKGIRNIVCCSNSKRMDDVYELINIINSIDCTCDKYIFRIWLDEADKFISFIDNTLYPIVDKHANVMVHLITATPSPLFQKYKYVNVFPIEVTTSELYHGWKNNKITIVEKEGNHLDYIEHVLRDIAFNEILPGTIWFIPGSNIKKSHIIIRNICVGKNMAVICVNSDGIVISLPDTLETVTYNKDDNFNEKLISLYKNHNLNRYALAITGYICIGRGITIMSNEFMIDYAILSQCSDPCEASQIAGRIKGNIRGFSNYKAPVVFTTSKFNKIAIDLEEKSRTLAKLAFEKHQHGEPTIIDKLEYKTCNKSYEYILVDALFNTFAEAKKYLETKSREMNTKVKDSKKSVVHKLVPSGHYVTSKLLRTGCSVSDLNVDDIITYEKAKTISKSTAISSTDKGSKYLILPLYENINSHPESVKYQVRYIKFHS
jgi:hypothetical protein